MKQSKMFTAMSILFAVFSVIFIGGAFGFSLIENQAGVIVMAVFFVIAGLASMLMDYMAKQTAKREWRTIR